MATHSPECKTSTTAAAECLTGTLSLYSLMHDDASPVLDHHPMLSRWACTLQADREAEKEKAKAEKEAQKEQQRLAKEAEKERVR